MKAVIIEDEEIIAQLLESKIQKVAPDVEVISVLSSVMSAREWLSTNSEPDLICSRRVIAERSIFTIGRIRCLTCSEIPFIGKWRSYF